MAPRLLIICMTSGNEWNTPDAKVGNIVEPNQLALDEKSVEAHVDESLAAPERSITLEQLAHGSERVGGMVVRSAQVRKVLKTISRLGSYELRPRPACGFRLRRQPRAPRDASAHSG